CRQPLSMISAFTGAWSRTRVSTASRLEPATSNSTLLLSGRPQEKHKTEWAAHPSASDIPRTETPLPENHSLLRRILPAERSDIPSGGLYQNSSHPVRQSLAPSRPELTRLRQSGCRCATS